MVSRSLKDGSIAFSFIAVEAVFNVSKFFCESSKYSAVAFANDSTTDSSYVDTAGLVTVLV